MSYPQYYRRATAELDAEIGRAKTTRNREEAAIVNKREALRRKVGIMRLRQQGLSQFEAEEQFECRCWRRMP